MAETKDSDPRGYALALPVWLVVVVGIVFLLWLSFSTLVAWKSQAAISHTTLMCTDRLIAEMDIRVALKDEAETLRRDNLRLTGRVQAFEIMLNVAHGNRTGDGGVGGPVQ